MKGIVFLVLINLFMISCGNNTTDHSQAGSNTSTSDTGSSESNSNSGINPPTDTVTGKGTDRIPSRTGTTGQGNTTVTGSATGSPTGTTKDSSK